jgi:hypothetical protein
MRRHRELAHRGFSASNQSKYIQKRTFPQNISDIEVLPYAPSNFILTSMLQLCMSLHYRSNLHNKSACVIGDLIFLTGSNIPYSVQQEHHVIKTFNIFLVQTVANEYTIYGGVYLRCGLSKKSINRPTNKSILLKYNISKQPNSAVI